MGSQTKVVPEVPSGIAPACLQGKLCQSDWHWPSPDGEGEKVVWCHPITTQAAADSTHGKCDKVNAFKHRGRKGNDSK